jgi:hypothetical protein
MDARDRALQRLIETLTPAAALGVACPTHDHCQLGAECRDRIAAAREMLASDLRVLFEG